jgi:hypothetical protein
MKIKTPAIIEVPQIIQLVIAICVFLFTFGVEVTNLGTLAFSNILSVSNADLTYACFPLFVFSIFAILSFIFTASQKFGRSFLMQCIAAACLALFLIAAPIIYSGILVNILAYVMLELLFSALEIVVCVILLIHLNGFHQYLVMVDEHKLTPVQAAPATPSAPGNPAATTPSPAGGAPSNPAPAPGQTQGASPSPIQKTKLSQATDPASGEQKSYLVSSR